MTRTEFLKKIFPKFAAALVLAGLIVYTVYHALGGASKPQTVPVQTITDTEIHSGTAWLFRDEQVLTVPEEGVTDPQVQNGVKVGKNTILAEVYTGFDDPDAVRNRLAVINRELAVLSAAELPASTSLSRAETYRSEALSDRQKILRAVASGDLSAVRDLEDGFLVALDAYASLTGSGSALKEKKTALLTEKQDLLMAESVTVRNTEVSGIFYDESRVDGMETRFTSAALERLTPDSLAELIASEPPDLAGYAVGKIAFGYGWSVALPVGEEIASRFEPGVTYRVAFPQNGGREIPMLCDKVIDDPDTGGGILVFSTGDTPVDFVYYRSQTVEIVVAERTGYYVPESALRTSGGVEGVFIFEDSTVSFRRINVLYRGDGYRIVSGYEENGKGYLAQNDMMITAGKNLRDGKVIK